MEVRKDLMIKRKVTRRHDRTRHARNTISIVKHCALHSRERNEDRKSVFPPFLNTNTHSAYACVRAWVDRRRCVCVCVRALEFSALVNRGCLAHSRRVAAALFYVTVYRFYFIHT